MTTNNLTDSVPQEQVDAKVIDATIEAANETTDQQTEEFAEMEAKIEKVDFSDEDAQLDADSPEYDLGDAECDEDQDEASVEVDYSAKTRDQINKEFADLLAGQPVQRIRKQVEAMKIAFYKTYRAEIENARREFIEAGGNPDEFIKPVDESEDTFKELFAQYRSKRDMLVNEMEKSKEQNLKEKLKIIEELKELIDSNETLNHTFTTFRELQQRWKETGVVPQNNVKDLWETYHLHVENFYNFIKINNELRDLDLRKNYEAKIKLAEEAEALSLETSIVDAFHQLQKLHEQWREVGPVSKEQKEQLWERFKEASSVINKKHQEHFDKIKEEQRRNFEMKSELCTKIEELIAAPHASRKEWNKASEELINVQKIWKTIGFAPKKENTKIYERFRKLCDDFFEKKRMFYTEIKSEMDNNYQLKIDICVQAEALQNSADWKKATDELIALQKSWKEIGAVSRRNSDQIWKRFRAACDTFFNRKSEHFGNIDKQYDENLADKRALLEEIRAFEIGDRESGFESVKTFQRRWSEIGFVPVKEKDKIQSEYKHLIDKIFTKLRGGEKERKIERFKEKVHTMKSGDNDRSLKYERERLYNKVRQLEADIQLWENNIGFFAKSKNADALVRDVQTKISRAKEEIAVIVEKVKLIDNKSEQ